MREPEIKKEVMAAVTFKALANMPGSAWGVNQSPLLLDVGIAAAMVNSWRSVRSDLEQVFRSLRDLKTGSSEAPLDAGHVCAVMAGACRDVLIHAGLPLVCEPRILAQQSVGNQDGSVRVMLVLPSLEGESKITLAAFAFVVDAVNKVFAAGGRVQGIAGELEKNLKAVVEAASKKRPPGTNTVRILEAAASMDVPWRRIGTSHYQLGWGVNGVMAKSTIFSSTASIAVALAKDKRSTVGVLKLAGFPVPKHSVAANLQQAKAIAADLGYPVVVKPCDLDGGVGVHAGLADEFQLENAWNETSTHKSAILVEKHLPGQDYRMIVLDGKLVWAVGRQPASVRGDGRNSLQELVRMANQDPRRGYHANATLRPIKLDEEALELMRLHGYQPDDVLPDGVVVPLRRAANVSSGGTPLLVTDRVHPDNQSMVESAVQTLGLDVAGVDLIVPDISRSWQETGGGIIEINAQPQLVASSQTHLYGEVIRAKVKGNGRIPVMVVVGKQASVLVDRFLDKLCQIDKAGAGIAVACGRGLFLDGRRLTGHILNSFVGGNAMLMRKETRSLVIEIDQSSFHKTGLPVDRFDVMYVAEDVSEKTQRKEQLVNTLRIALPHCRNMVVLTDDGMEGLLRKSGMRSSQACHSVGKIDAAVDHLYKVIFQEKTRIEESP